MRLLLIALLLATAPLPDPGKGLSEQAARTARMNAWQRPATAGQRKTLRDARIAAANARTPKAQAARSGQRIAYPPNVVLVFQSRAIADTVLKEIAATPEVDNGIGPVWVWYPPDGERNDVSYAHSDDGRAAIAHPWSEVNREWLAAYCAEWIAAGEMQITAALPGDWKWPMVARGVAP